MPGDVDPLYVKARTALLDAVDALRDHLGSLALVGAQAIYIHTGDADLAVAEYTTDADFSVEPRVLAGAPLIEDLLKAAGFTTREHPGGWASPTGIYVDLMVAEAAAGKGRRGVDLGPHGRRAARRARGLEGAVVDNAPHLIESLDASDTRSVMMNVAGPGALLIAKLHKLHDRTEKDERIKDKDALDVFRLLRAIATDDLARRLRLLMADRDAGQVTQEGLGFLRDLFGRVDGAGIELAIRASARLIDPGELTYSAIALTDELLELMARDDASIEPDEAR